MGKYDVLLITTICIIILLLVARLVYLYLFKHEQSTKVVTAHYDELKHTMAVVFDDGRLETFYNRYNGTEGLWCALPMMEKLDADSSSKLDQVLTYIKYYGNPFPTAHQTNLKGQ